MKLQYRETKWWAGIIYERGGCKCDECNKSKQLALEAFKEIASQDQEKVDEFIIMQQTKSGVTMTNDWKKYLEIGKLYDSGDLVFEHQWQQKRRDQDESHWVEHTNWPWDKRNLESKIFEYREVWVLKDKAKERNICRSYQKGSYDKQHS